MTIFIYKGFQQKSAYRKYSILSLSNICRLAQFRDTKFGTNVSNEKLPNAEKC